MKNNLTWKMNDPIRMNDRYADIFLYHYELNSRMLIDDFTKVFRLMVHLISFLKICSEMC